MQSENAVWVLHSIMCLGVIASPAEVVDIGAQLDSNSCSQREMCYPSVRMSEGGIFLARAFRCQVGLPTAPRGRGPTTSRSPTTRGPRAAGATPPPPHTHLSPSLSPALPLSFPIATHTGELGYIQWQVRQAFHHLHERTTRGDAATFHQRSCHYRHSQRS